VPGIGTALQPHPAFAGRHQADHVRSWRTDPQPGRRQPRGSLRHRRHGLIPLQPDTRRHTTPPGVNRSGADRVPARAGQPPPLGTGRSPV
jgi:hypothetical protein